MAMTTVVPGKFSAEAAVAGTTGSCVFVASGPASFLKTAQFSQTAVFVSRVRARGHLTITGKRSIVYTNAATSGVTGNAAGFVRIATGGSTKLTNPLIKSNKTVIMLCPALNTAIRGWAYIKGNRHTAGSTIICLKTGTGTALTGKVFYRILPES